MLGRVELVAVDLSLFGDQMNGGTGARNG
ncbi:hypothetical protein B0I32_1041, partial [Nonomuraea fuscirosea]